MIGPMRHLISIYSALCISIPVLFGQDLPGCEARSEVRRALHADLSDEKLAGLTWKERQALQDRVVNDLIAKYPREIAPHFRLIRDARWPDPQRLPGVQARYRTLAVEHPDDPLALILAARALDETDLRLGEKARQKAPQFPAAALFLAETYSEGLRADKAKFGDNLRAYFAMCPASADSLAHYLLPKLGDQALQARVAKASRNMLQNETDVTLLNRYSSLWALEFRTTPPAGHDVLRKQVGEDVKRLEALNPHPDGDYFELLTSGYKQSGASKENLTAFENRILNDVPASNVAFDILYERRKKSNPEPESQTDLVAWKAYNAAYQKQIREWEKQYPAVNWLANERVSLMFEDDNLSEAEGVAAVEALLTRDAERQPPMSSLYVNSSSMLLGKKWQPQRALDLLAKARPLVEAERDRLIANDNMSAAMRAQQLEFVDYPRQGLAAGTLRAAIQLKKPEAADAVRGLVEAPLAKDAKKGLESRYWTYRGLLASLDRRQADALTYFQLALRTRPEAPKAYHGKVKDPLLDEAKDLWKQLGGTETAFALWNSAPGAAAEEQKQGRWEKPLKDLPAFELSDLSGKTWRLKALEGKTVLINLWATWCGPCKAELPQFQKLYEKVKDRSDVQVITFNLDDELGLVAPFMKENGYSFPVLLANEFTRALLEGIIIPQNWVVDASGKWRWTQLGYGGEPDWPGEMVKRLESTK